jgi:hypothetical protein
MDEREARRITRPLTEADEKRVRRHREEIAEELPEMAARDQMRNEARQEGTLSGQLRRAVHASELSLSAIAAGAGITPLQLDEFLTGERTLRSDVIDRLAHVLGCRLSETR